MKLHSILWNSFSKCFGAPATFLTIIFSFASIYFTNSINIKIMFLCAFFTFIIMFILTLIYTIDFLYRNAYNIQSEIVDCIQENDDIIFFAETNSNFIINTIVTIYIRIPSNKSSYEKAFCIGEIQNIQNNGLIQIKFISAINASAKEIEDVKNKNSAVINNLFVKPVVNRLYLNRGE